MKNYAGLLIKCENRYLLCKRSARATFPGMWSVPGGEIEANEEAEEAAVRETLEETQIPIQAKDTAYVATLSGSAHDGGNFHLYITEIEYEQRPILDFEHVASGWFMLDSMPKPMEEHLQGVMLNLNKENSYETSE